MDVGPFGPARVHLAHLSGGLRSIGRPDRSDHRAHHEMIAASPPRRAARPMKIRADARGPYFLFGRFPTNLSKR